MKSGNTYRVAKSDALDISDHLEGGNYVIKEDNFGNLYLEKIEDFTIPNKVYGDCLKNTSRIINTFLDRDVSTGVMLTGEKGSGKTLLTKNVAFLLAQKNIPTIVINSPWHGDKFNTFIQSIEQPCVVIFDEFEKTYDSDEQESILTLLDGVFPTKKLFMITCNDKWRVDYHMRNRPGRIYYLLDFVGLDEAFIIEYCNDNLKNKTHIQKICRIATLFAEFNFDMLKALVEEMNRYDEDPQQALKLLNAKPEFDSGTKYEVSVIHEGKEVPQKDISPQYYEGSPLQPKGIWIEFQPDNDSNSEVIETLEVKFSPDSLVNIDSSVGKFVFEDKGTKLILTRKRTKTYDYYNAF
jgi:hypothetical protein